MKVGSTTFVAAQTLASADRVASDLTALELVAGPVLLLGVFLGTLLIGVKAAEPVEAARRRQLEFTADASHELRTPLSVIEAEVSLALSSQRTEEQYRDTLQRVGRESRRLTEIVENLLWLSRFDSAPPPPRDLLVDVGAIGISCADRFAVLAQQRGIALTVEVDAEGAPLVHAPPEWIDRLAAVLVDNACRYAGSRGHGADPGRRDRPSGVADRRGQRSRYRPRGARAPLRALPSGHGPRQRRRTRPGHR